jgi:hypothetical protein
LLTSQFVTRNTWFNGLCLSEANYVPKPIFAALQAEHFGRLLTRHTPDILDSQDLNASQFGQF